MTSARRFRCTCRHTACHRFCEARMRRFRISTCWMALLCLLLFVSVLGAACSTSPSTPSSLVAAGDGPAIVPYTGGPTSGAGKAAILTSPTPVPVNVNGVAVDFSGGAASFAFRVGATIVRGDAFTIFFGESALDDLHNNVYVNVKGVQRDGFVYAERLHVHKGDDTVGGTSIPPEPAP